MASLRRPSQAISRPQQQSQQTTLRPPMPGDAVAKRDARKSKVGDKIKKRMSMRYAGPSEESSAYVPAMPTLPGQPTIDMMGSRHVLSVDMPGDNDDDDDAVGESRFNQFASADFQRSGLGKSSDRGRTALDGDERIGRRGAQDTTKDEEWDFEELANENFDIQGFMRRTLAGADENEVKRFKAALQRSKQSNAKELQRNVFKHYAEFVTMSKEIATLENDMLELKELLGQWKDLPQLMGMEDTLAPTLDKNGNMERRRTQRNSVADLQQLYKAQLSNLWSTVEGSQKYLPIVPGRHLVFETHAFVELNAATYKAKQSVSMFLLSDLLLIAGRRRTKNINAPEDQRREGERGRMIAERCWVLADLVVVDVKDSGDLTNALKIRRGKEVCVYRTSKPEDKKALLGAFRQVSQELGEKKRKESEKEQQRRKSMWHGDAGSTSTPASPNPAGLLSPGRPVSMMGLTVSDTKDLRWIDDFGDELTMAIAMRDWELATSLVEKSAEMQKIAAPNPAAKESLESRLEHLRPKLFSQMLHDLSSPDLRKAGAARLIAWLTRLDAADLARDTFLKARRDVMMRRVRAIKCDGDTTIYISELAIVCFTVLRHTSDWYMTAFKENRMASGFVTWAKEQIEAFADMFRRQVYAPDIPQQTVEECSKIIASHNRKLLRDVGLDFTFLLSTVLSPDPKATSSHRPMFDLSAPTPAPGYHIEPSPYTSTSFFDSPLPPPQMPGPGQRRPSGLSRHESANSGHQSSDAGYSLGGYDDSEFDVPPLTGTTAPLSINPRSPRRPRVSDNAAISPSPQTVLSPASPGSPAPPPRSARRAVPARNPSSDLGHGRDGNDDSLR